MKGKDMSDLSKKYQEILEGLERNIKDKNELNLMRSQLSELVIYFTDMINRTEEIEENISKVDRNIKRLSRRIDTIEDDIYIDSEDDENLEELGSDQMHDNDFEFEITCPYCDYEFITDNSYKNEEAIKCPKCRKIIELDWNMADEDCYGDCRSCESHCYAENTENDKSVAEDEDDYKVEIKPEDNSKNKQNNNSDKKENENEDDM